MEYGKIEFSQGFYHGEIKNGMANGMGRVYFNNGDIYIGEMKDNCMTGIGAMSTAKYITVGGFVNGKRQGHCCTIYFGDDGWNDNRRTKYYVGNYTNDIKTGRGVYLYDNDDFYDGNFQNDLPNGKGCYSQCTWSEKEGCFYEGNFVNGRVVGEYTMYAETWFQYGKFFGYSQPENNYYSGYGEWIDKGPDPKRRIGYHNILQNHKRQSNFKGVKIYGTLS